MDRFTEMKVFVLAVQASSLSGAARQLSLTPSAVSRVVKRLEKRLSVTLLQRSPRAIMLTPEGEIFYERARKALVALAEAEDISQYLEGRVIRLRCIPTLAIYQLAPLMPDYCQLFPDLRIEFILGNETVGPLDGGADIAIVSGKLKDSALVATKLASTRWSFCASPGYIAKFGLPTSTGDLEFHRCLGFSMHSPWNEWPTETADNFRRVPHQLTANEGTMILALVKQGMGVARLADYHIYSSIKDRTLVRILPDAVGTDEPIYLVFRKEMQSNPRIRSFVNFLRDAFRSPPWSDV